MDARQAVRALQDIRPAAAVPIHWGSLAPVGLHLRQWPYLTRPALEFEALARRLTPEIAVRVLLPGDAVTV
jgi:L-ascorbate metabolism protein UlaG (beta-lactamase superfamily)